jgi:hypothetical protein
MTYLLDGKCLLSIFSKTCVYKKGFFLNEKDL